MVGLVLGARRPEIDLGVRPDAKTYYGIRIESPKVSSTEVKPVVTGRLSKRVPVGQELRIITTSPNRDRYWVQEPVVVDPEKPAWHGTAGISKTSGNHTWILATVVGPTSLAWWSHCRRVTQLTGQWEPIEGKLPPDIVVCDEVLIERK